MSLLDEEEYLRWVEMARRPLRSVERDLMGGDYNWACFKAHKPLNTLLWGCCMVWEWVHTATAFQLC